MVLLDSQAVKNTDSADQTGFCHYKCTNGIKRHMLVDVLGIPVCVKITTANIGDREGGKKLAKENQDILKGIKAMLADHGYASKGFKISIKKTTGITVTISPKPTKAKGEKGFKPVHKRRIVERSNARMDKCRRLHKNNEAYIDTSEAMIHLCFIRLCLRRLSGRNKSGSRAKKI